MDVDRFIYFGLSGLAAFFFSLRFLIQWYVSEKQKTSVIPLLFWHLSLWGNLCIGTHYFIQNQYGLCVVQGFNGIISWRNLNLHSLRPIRSYKTIVFFLGLSWILITALFWVRQQAIHMPFFSLPTFYHPHSASLQIHWGWFLLGIIGPFLFSSRYWVQWWNSEKNLKSVVNASFWWLSILGAFLTIVYAIHMHDVATLWTQIPALIPYMRNLVLLKKKPTKERI